MHLRGTTIDQFNDYYKFCSVVAIWAIPLVDQVPKCYKIDCTASRTTHVVSRVFLTDTINFEHLLTSKKIDGNTDYY